jgi:hypothetical protein
MVLVCKVTVLTLRVLVREHPRPLFCWAARCELVGPDAPSSARSSDQAGVGALTTAVWESYSVFRYDTQHTVDDHVHAGVLCQGAALGGWQSGWQSELGGECGRARAQAYRNSVPVPRHWSQKRKYLQGKRGLEKPPFRLPEFIEATGIGEMRQAYQEKARPRRTREPRGPHGSTADGCLFLHQCTGLQQP